MNRYFVYILTNYLKTVLYTGVTNNINRRLREHTEDAKGNKKTFAGKYQCIYLLYYEEYQLASVAIAREKEIKNMARAKKVALIEAVNPEWRFLNG